MVALEVIGLVTLLVAAGAVLGWGVECIAVTWRDIRPRKRKRRR
jgi:hypothetical protein